MNEQQQEDPPVIVVDGGLRWVRTEIRKGADLVDGSGWIDTFNSRLSEVQQSPKEQQPPRSRRLLRQTATDGDCPQFWGSAGLNLANLGLRNEVLDKMRPDRLFGPSADMSRGPGRMVRLATGEDVIFWFNVGPPGLPRERVYVTSAYCPHQGVCLNTGELRDIEDVAGVKRAMVRCPRHHKTFDLKTGESMGNAEKLPVYPCRFEHGHWYVAVGPALDETAGCVQSQTAQEAAVTAASVAPKCLEVDGDVDMAQAEEPLWKRQRAEEVPPKSIPPEAQKPTWVAHPAAAQCTRQLAHCASVG